MEPAIGLLLLFGLGAAAFLGHRVTRVRGPKGERRRWDTGLLWRTSGLRDGCKGNAKCFLESSGSRHVPGERKRCEGCDRVCVRDSYGTLALGVAGFVPDPDGPLVSSLCDDGTHAPALDVDDGLEWIPTKQGRGGKLIFKTGVTESAYGKVAGVFEATGLGSGVPPSLTPDLPGIDGYRTTTMRAEAAFDLRVPARVVGSRTPGHHHLYIEAYLSWERYAKLLRALAAAGLIEPAFCDAAMTHEMTVLRRSDRPAERPKDPPFRLPGPPPAPASVLAPRPSRGSE